MATDPTSHGFDDFVLCPSAPLQRQQASRPPGIDGTDATVTHHAHGGSLAGAGVAHVAQEESMGHFVGAFHSQRRSRMPENCLVYFKENPIEKMDDDSG